LDSNWYLLMKPDQHVVNTPSERWSGLDQWSSDRIAQELLTSHLEAITCVQNVSAGLAEAGDRLVARLGNGRGRLIYCGAGSAGAQACLDGLELSATYGWPEGRLALLLAGGLSSFRELGGATEDDTSLALNDLESLDLGKDDALIAVSASGNTPYTVAVTELAAAKGALTVAVINNRQSRIQTLADHCLVLETGVEAIAGSTRMAAGSAQKIVLNTLSSLVMVRLGFVYDHHMVRMKVSNKKLQSRATNMVCTIAACDEQRARECLAKAGQDIPLAVLLAKGKTLQLAREKLEQCGGNLRQAMADQ